MIKKFLVILSLMLFVFSCVPKEIPTPTSQIKTVTEDKTDNASVVKSNIVPGENITSAEDNEKTLPKSEIEYGKKLVNSSPKVLITKEGDKFDVSLIFDSADVYEVVKTIFTEVIKSNFIVDNSVKGNLTLAIKGLYSENEILELLSKALDLSNLSLLNDNGTFVVTTKANIKEQFPSLEDSGLYAVEIIQLKNINADYFAKNLASFASKGAVVNSLPMLNSVLIFDKKSNIQNMVSLIKIVDSEVFKGILFKIFPVKSIKASEASALLREILASGDVINKAGVSTGTYITDLKSNNSILVLSRNEEIFNYINAWLVEIDKKNESDESGVYVYYVENGKAVDIANLLNQLWSESSSSTTKGNVIVQGAADSKSPAPKTGFISANLSNDVKIIPDEKNNAILIKANPDDYQTIMTVMKQIDVEPRQVLIDVLIAEVTYNNSIKYGIQWYLKNNGVKIGDVNYSGIGMLNQGQTLPNDTALGASNILGFAYGLYNPVGDLRLLLSAIEDKSKINILSSPNVLAIDNEKATIEVGQDVPTITQSVTNTSSDGTVTNSVQYRNTGILLEVTPHINSKNSVRLEVKQEVSEAQTNKVSGIDSPVFLKRRAETILVVKDQETVVIGGLIQEKKDNSKSGVPFLSSIPILGYLFGGTSKNDTKTELVIAITPRVVKNDSSVQKLSRDFIMRLNEVKDILTKNRDDAFKYGDIK